MIENPAKASTRSFDRRLHADGKRGQPGPARSADLQGYGNSLSNAIYGNSGNNILDGGAGAD